MRKWLKVTEEFLNYSSFDFLRLEAWAKGYLYNLEPGDREKRIYTVSLFDTNEGSIFFKCKERLVEEQTRKMIEMNSHAHFEKSTVGYSEDDLFGDDITVRLFFSFSEMAAPITS